MNWTQPPERLAITTGEVHVWRVALDVTSSAVDQCFALLSPEEQFQAGRFTFDDGRRRFSVARGTLRRVLSRYLDATPEAHILGTGPHGKPFLRSASSPSDGPRVDGDRHDLRFNMSHTKDLAVIAVAWQCEVGIDVEHIDRSVEMGNLARRFFSSSEAEAVLSADTETRRHVFFRIWTTKEAYIKARGDGFSLPLDQFDVVADLTKPPGLLATRHDPADQDKWTFAEVNVDGEFVCALAVEGHSATVSQWTL